MISENPGVSKSKTRAVARAARWQLATRLGYERALVNIGPAKFYCYPGYTVGSGALYTGFLEWDETAFVLRFLRPGDHFMDIGANIGAFSVFAGTFVPGITITSVEPGDGAREKLVENLELNDLPTDRVFDCAVGDAPGTVEFTTDLDVMNSVAAEGAGSTVSVEMSTVDLLAGDLPVDLMKVDVEGVELSVFKGAVEQLAMRPGPAIIFELNGLCKRFDIEPAEVTGFLSDHGLRCFEYDGRTNALTEFSGDGIPASNNLVATADVERLTERIENAQLPVDLTDLPIKSSLERLN